MRWTLLELARTWLGNGVADREAACLRVIQLLLQGIRLHAVPGDATDYDKFCRDLKAIEDAVAEHPPAARLHFLSGAALKALEEYNRRAAWLARQRSVELQAIVSLLNKTIAGLCKGAESTVLRLQDIERQLEKAEAIEDIRLAKLRLSECLEGLREQSLRQREEGRRAIERLKAAIKQVPRPATSGPKDAATGLLGPAEAEQRLAEVIHERAPIFTAVFVITNMHSINTRYGHAIGDQILRLYAEHLAGSLPGDALFRWSGPCFLALLRRAGTLEQVRRETALIAAKRLECTLPRGASTVLVTPSAASWVFPPADSLAALMEKIDHFVASHSAAG
jgi:GGDEF domain-containing protein